MDAMGPDARSGPDGVPLVRHPAAHTSGGPAPATRLRRPGARYAPPAARRPLRTSGGPAPATHLRWAGARYAAGSSSPDRQKAA